MSSSGMLRRVALVKTDASEELIASIIRVTRNVELGKLTVTRNSNTTSSSLAGYCFVPSSPILITLIMEKIPSSDTSVLARAILRNIPVDGTVQSHCSENLKSYRPDLI
jgi:hypothetical protein